MNREALLKWVVGAAIGLLVLDYAVIEPAIGAWNDQGARIAAVKKKVLRGRVLLERQRSIRGKWAEMVRTDLADDNSAADEAMSRTVARWTQNSHVVFPVLDNEWHSHEEGYDTLEYRATAAGDQASLGRLLYEMESDTPPARLVSAELNARDAKGQQLTMALRFTFVRLNEGAEPTPGKGAR